MMKKLAMSMIAATFVAVSISLPRVSAQQAAAPVNPAGTLKPEPFADVPPDHWAYNAVEFLRAQGLAEGYPDKTYKGKRPLTRYEFAQVIYRMLNGLIAQINAAKGGLQPAPTPTVAGVTTQQLNEAIANATKNMLTPEDVRRIVQEELAKQPKPQTVDLSNYVTKDQLAALQKLVNEFRDELARMGVNIDALQKELTALRGRVQAIEEELARMPRIIGDANIIGKTSWQSDQNFLPGTNSLRPAYDHDARPMKASTDILRGGRDPLNPASTTLGESILGYYDLDLGIVAKPVADVRVGAIMNVGNYLSSYRNFPQDEHGYNATGAAQVRPYKVFINVPFRFLGSNEITVGLQGTQLTPYTFWAVDPDVYTFIPREDSGEVVFWGLNTNWRFGQAKFKAFAGVNPEDGRLIPGALNVYPQLTGSFGGVANTAFFSTGSAGTGPTVFVGAPAGVTALTAAFGTPDNGRAPITFISNFAGGRFSWGEPTVPPYRAEALPVGTAEQYNLTTTTPRAGSREVTTEAGTTTAATPAAAEAPVAATGVSFGPLRNVVLGINYLIAAGRRDATVEDKRAQVMGADGRFKLGPIRFEGEYAYGISDAAPGRPRALKDSAYDLRGFFTFGLGSIADFDLGGGFKRIGNNYVVPGYWGLIGAWKNPRGIEGPVAEVRVPLKWNIASFFRNIVLKASGEWYHGIGTGAASGAAAGPDLERLEIDRYVAGMQFALTSRNTVSLGVEQVFRDYVAAVGTAPLSLPTAGFGGMPLAGSRIKDTETYINFGIGHNFTPDIALQLLYQIVDFAKYSEDRSNQPESFRGYVASAQVGVRF